MRNLFKYLVFSIGLFAVAPLQAASIIPSLPINLVNGSLADATQVMSNFNTIVTDVNMNAAHTGANSDITSLTGLTTPLSPTYGGSNVYTGGLSTGAANAQVVATTTPSGLPLSMGNIVTFISGFTNTSAMTLNVGSTGIENVMKLTPAGLVALGAGDITAGGEYVVIWDGVQWNLINPTTAYVKAVYKQVFTSSGTYTPHAGMLYAVVQEIGGGGGGGGSVGAANPSAAAGGGGGSGSYAEGIYSATTIGASQTVTIGAGGMGGGAGANNGNPGTGSSFGSLLTTSGGGGGGFGSQASVVARGGTGGIGGTIGSGGYFAQAGGSGGIGIDYGLTSQSVSGAGSDSFFGPGAVPATENFGGGVGPSYGSGGSGGASSTASVAAGNGAGGIIIITEFSSQ